MSNLKRVERYRRLARWVLGWERAWPAFAPAMLVAGAFVALGLMDALPPLPGWLHTALLICFALAFAASLGWGWRWLKRPSREAVDRRLERDSGFDHRPLAALDDSLSGGANDPRTVALWRVHRRRTEAALRRLRVAPPRPGLPARDPYALRAVVFLMLAVGLLVGGGDGWSRLSRALAPNFAFAADIPVRPQAARRQEHRGGRVLGVGFIPLACGPSCTGRDHRVLELWAGRVLDRRP